jgi:hypothetical protein
VLKLIPLNSTRRLDVIVIIYLAAASFIVTIFFLDNHGQTMINFDAYDYFQSAISIAEGTSHSVSSSAVTLPTFLVYLSLLYRLFSDPSTALMPLRIINLCMTVQLVIFFYLIARKMFNVFFSFIGAFMTLFLPVVMTYSGTLHSDIFAIAMGLASLYFSIKPRRIVHVVLATIFIILSSARLDIAIVFALPYFVGLIQYIQSKTHVKFLVLFIIFSIIFFVPLYFVIQNTTGLYAVDYFHHSILKQVITLVRFETIKTVLQSSVEVTGESAIYIDGYDVLNKLYVSIIFAGLIFFVFNYKKMIYKIFTTLKYQFSEANTTVIYLVITSLLSLITLAAFHIDFTAINGSTPVAITPRYMIAMRLFLLFVFIYGLSLVSTAYGRIVFQVTKYKTKSSHGKLLTGRQNNVTTISVNDIPESIMETKYKINTYVSYLFVLFIVTLFLIAMWDSTIRVYESQSVVIVAYHKTSQWLSDHLGKDEMVFLPAKQVFWTFDPTLKDRTYVYNSVWNSAGVKDNLNTTNAQILLVRQNFKDFIHNDNNRVKYLVFHPADFYFSDMSGITVSDLSKGIGCEKLDQKLKEVTNFVYVIPETKWDSTLVICEVNKTTG